MEINKDLTYILTDETYPSFPRDIIEFETREDYELAKRWMWNKMIRYERKTLNMQNSEGYKFFIKLLERENCKFKFIEIETMDLGDI